MIPDGLRFENAHSFALLLAECPGTDRIHDLQFGRKSRSPSILLDELKQLSMLQEPPLVTAFRPFRNFLQELHRFGFIARFAGIIRRDDHFDIYSHNVPASLNQACSFEAFSGYSHHLILIQKVNGDEFCDTALFQV